MRLQHRAISCFAMTALASKGVSSPPDDLCSTSVLARTGFSFEASLSHRESSEAFRIVGFDSTTNAWYLIQYGTPVGVDHAGRMMAASTGTLDYLPIPQSPVRRDATFIEQFIAPTLFLAGLCADNRSAMAVTQEDSGAFACVATLTGSRYDTAVGLPSGMKVQTSTITIWTDYSGLPTRIRRSSDGPIEPFDYEPSSLTKIPIARTADNGTWTLQSLTWLTPSDPRFTLEGLRKRAAQPDTRPRKPAPPPLSPEEKARADAESLKSAVAAGIVSQSTLSSYQWPLVITGSLLVALGVIAYVRSRRN